MSEKRNFEPQADILTDMIGVLADTLRSHVFPNSQVKGAPTQHCEVAVRSTRNPESLDSMGRKRQAPEVVFYHPAVAACVDSRGCLNRTACL
jgi:hypothetical protein